MIHPIPASIPCRGCSAGYAFPIQPDETKKSCIRESLFTSIYSSNQLQIMRSRVPLPEKKPRWGPLLTRHISRAAFFFNTPPCFIASFISTSFMTKYGFGSIRRLLHSCCSAGVSKCRSVAFSFVSASAPFCHPFIPPLLMGFLFPNSPVLYPPLAGDGEEGMLLAGVGDEPVISAGTDVGGYLGCTSGLIGGVSTGGVALEE